MILYFVMTTKNEEEDIECCIIINRNRHNITYVYMFLFSIKIIAIWQLLDYKVPSAVKGKDPCPE